ncbi:1,4-dihydroxy-2-naphthoate octaprenyltransferase [uncultured archaeon]|nr:1,4-dihydroxy-2-naphthoate octaprenyltransferase [uncultured archaeon]
MKNLAELLRLCNNPTSIISPFPFFAIAIFLISHKNLSYSEIPFLIIGIVVTLLSNSASNLWNHCNDLKEDIAQGKKTILTQDPSMQKIAIIFAILLYIISLILVYKISLEVEKPIYIYFLIWAIATWCYSDNIIIKKVTGFRLKEHYIGELVTYGVAWPMYTLSIWLIYSDITITGEIIILAFFFFSISLLLLKDLKDISGDRKAGLMTFGVVFSPSKLIRFSCYLMVVYFFIILNPITMKYFNNGILIMIVPLAYFSKNTFVHMYQKNWILDIGDLKALKSLGISVYASVIFLGLSVFF